MSWQYPESFISLIKDEHLWCNESYDGLCKQHRHQHVVKAGCDDDVRRSDLFEHVLSRRHRLLDDPLLVIAPQLRLQDRPELVEHDDVTVAEQEPYVVVLVQQPPCEDRRNQWVA